LGGGVSAIQTADEDAFRAECFAEPVFPIPTQPRPAAVEVEGGQRVLRVRVAGQVRFGEQVEPRHAAGVREAVPVTAPDRVQVEFAKHPFAELLKRVEIAERVGFATECFNDPLDADKRRGGGGVRFQRECRHRVTNHGYSTPVPESTCNPDSQNASCVDSPESSGS